MYLLLLVVDLLNITIYYYLFILLYKMFYKNSSTIIEIFPGKICFISQILFLKKFWKMIKISLENDFENFYSLLCILI